MLTLLLACSIGASFGPGAWDTGWSSTTSPRVGGDTGFAWFYWAGSVASSGGDFDAGYFGVAVYGEVEGDYVCLDLGHLEERSGGAGCAGCSFAFHFTVADTSPTGEFCDSLGLGSDGDFDGMEVGFGWGPPSYAYDYGYGEILLYDPVYMYYTGEWFLFAYDYYYSDYVRISGGYMRFVRPYFYAYGSSSYWLSGYYAR